MSNPTQSQMFYAASRAAGERDSTFMELVNHPTNPMTREDLESNIARRPALWSRYAGFLDKLPSRASLEWSGSPCSIDPDNYWIDDATGERVNAETGERTPPVDA